MNERIHNLSKSNYFKSIISLHKDINGQKQDDRIIPISEDTIKFWNDMCSIRKKHKQHPG